jgi:transcription-repair coupling factor (superfamily II helicase)
VQWGYRRVPLVEEKGEVGVRGGIIDLFPPSAEEPLRIEFFGDTVESLRFFDPASQRSTKQSDEISLLPVRFFSATRLQASRRTVEDAMAESEIPHREQQRIAENLKSGLPFPGAEFLLPYLYPTLESVADYLPSNTLVCMVDPVNGEAALETYSERLVAYAADAKAAERFAPPPAWLFCTSHDVAAQLATRRTIALVGLENVDTDLVASSMLLTDLKLQSHTKGERSLAPLATRINQWREDGVQVLLVVSNSCKPPICNTSCLGTNCACPC